MEARDSSACPAPPGRGISGNASGSSILEDRGVWFKYGFIAPPSKKLCAVFRATRETGV
jgi:hypothetical protein